MNFELPLTEEKVKPHQVTALHLTAALTFVGAGALIYLFMESSRLWSGALIIAGIGLLYAAMFRNKWLIKPERSRIFRIVELVIALMLTGIAAWLKWTPPAVIFGILTAALLFSVFWEGGKSTLSVLVDETGIKLPVSARRRFIDWKEVDRALLKFGIFTVNCSDNRMYQWTLGSINFDKEAFQSFCNKCVEEGKTKRDKNDW